MSRPRAWNSTLPARSWPMERSSGLQASGGLARSPAGPKSDGEAGQGLRRAPIRPVSARRVAENRARAAMVTELWPGSRGDGQDRPLCEVYELAQRNPGVIPPAVLKACGRWASDVHEPLTRARGGSITDPGNATVPCRPCHDAIGLGPAWAYRLGLLKHSWGGDAA